MGITVRAIRDDDLEKIMNWRMRPDITKYMNTNPRLTLEGQKKWLSDISTDPKVKYWIIEIEGIASGVINLADIDRERKTASWAYYIGEKELRSFDVAISLEMSLYDYVFEELEFVELHNEVFSLNKGVIKIHCLCGNRIVDEVKGKVVKEGISYDVTHLSITAGEWKSIKPDMEYEKVSFVESYQPTDR